MENYLLNIKAIIRFIYSKLSLIYKLLGIEGIIWIVSLTYLASLTNSNHQHFTICPLSNLGFEHCPGCGLGKSISMILHGNIFESFDFHLLGIPALIIIIFRIFQLIKINFHIHFKTLNKGVNHA
uniref:DUF2752 domain-containing protein n=1 Tax=Ignavibacterium album TaxID=591197 RepID=A0A832G7X0_9BACT